MRDTPVPIIAYLMVGLTSAVLAYVTYYDNNIPEELKNQENTESKSNIPTVAGILPTAAMLPAFLTGKKEEPPLTEAKVEEEMNEPKNEPNNEPNNENREQEQQQPVENEIKQTGGKKSKNSKNSKKSKKNKTKNHKLLHKCNKNNKTKHCK